MTVGSKTATYAYDADGIRTQKIVDGVTHTYYTLNGKLMRESFPYSDTTIIMDFIYDESGRPFALNYSANGTDFTTYYYVLNLQGDVVKLVTASGAAVATYTYDAWGNHLSISGSMAAINPLRYRGYYYDFETGLYYVSSRYYDPEIGRWISPEPNVYNGEFDEGAGLIGYNVYAYCANNPVNYYDPTGEFVISTLLICVAAGAIIGGTIGGIAGNAYANSKGYTGWDKTKSILTGIGMGGLAGGALGYFAAPAVVSATGVAGISITSGGISTIAAFGTSFGKLGTLIANNGQQIIDWGKTTWHGMQRMIERGVTQNMVEVWAKTGKALQQAGDKILYITKQGAVVIDKAGKVITAYTSQYFNPAMQEVVEKLFGK